LPRGCINAVGPDGIGTKTVVVDAAFLHGECGYDLLAMGAGDITRWGGLPLVFTNDLNVKTLGKEKDRTNEACKALIRGLGQAVTDLEMVLLQGETAELGICVGSDNHNAIVAFNWDGTAHGVYHLKKMILGDTLSEGQAIMALREYGFRCNGYSSVRKAFALKFGPEWYKNPKAKKAIQQAARHSTLYDLFLTDMNGWRNVNYEPIIKMHLIVHVTGGSIRSKFAEDILFPQGLSADLPDLWELPEIMRQCAKWRGMSDEECHEIWNGGQGALVVIDKDDVPEFIELAGGYNLEAKQAGKITKEREPIVRIASKFKGGDIIFRPE